MANSSGSKVDEELHNLKEGIKVCSLVKTANNFSEMKSHRPWSNLPADVLGEILQSLSLADQIRLSCVCKSSLELFFRHDRPVDRLPWLITCDNSESDGFVCKLFDPMHKKPYQIDRITGPGMDSFRPDYVTSKDGWLLFLREKGRYTAELFLFCPYTKEIIVLPDLCHGVRETPRFCWCGRSEDEDCVCPSKDRRRILTFSSSDPRSPECVFFAAYYIYDNVDGKITICSYQRKDKGWTTKGFNGKLNYVKISNLVYSQGYLYCMNTDGCLGVYNVRGQEWFNFNSWPKAAHKHGRFHLVASEGRLLMAMLDDSPCCKLYRLNYSSSNKEWVHQKVLKNQALFLGHQPWECTILVPMLRGDLEFVGNKIFYRDVVRGTRWRFYDFNESKHHICDGTEFEYFVPRAEEKHTKNKDPEALIGMSRGWHWDPLALWIEPPNHVLKPLHS